MSTCHVCASQNTLEARFCNWCGTPLHTQKQTEATATDLLPSYSSLHYGRYTIIEQVGKGGMGAVYKALDLKLQNRVVAIKEMSQHGLHGSDLTQAVNAFLNEAFLLVQLHHPRLPHVYGQFEDHGKRYLVMEFITGETLEQLLQRLHILQHRLSIEQVISIALMLCDVLHYLHTHNPPVVFRDLKPSNIMLNSQGHLYLIDFGIARLFKPGQYKDTVALGSSGYAPPEQYQSTTSPRSDIYSLGATLHYMLTGDDPSRHPFSFRPLTLAIPELNTLIQNMVTLNEKMRPASIAQVKESLHYIAQQLKFFHSFSRKQHHARLHHLSQSTTPLPTLAHVTTKHIIDPLVVTIHTLLSLSEQDQRLWKGIRKQLLALLTDFPHVSISEGPQAEAHCIHTFPADFTSAHLILLLLSPNFLQSPDCCIAAEKALQNANSQISSLMLYTCHPQIVFPKLQAVPKHEIFHVSPYAQEQRILEAAKAIRRYLVSIMIPSKRGMMNILQWLIWQLYGSGRTTCPYFTIGEFTIKAVRPSGTAGMLLHVYRNGETRIIAEYIIGPIQCQDFSHFLQLISGSPTTNPEMLHGMATQYRPMTQQ